MATLKPFAPFLFPVREKQVIGEANPMNNWEQSDWFVEWLKLARKTKPTQ